MTKPRPSAPLPEPLPVEARNARLRGRAAFVVLGCAKNQVEAESMSSRLAGLGWEMTMDVPNAEVVVVHTCGFLEAARQEALKTISDIRRAAPRSFLVMTGCFAQYLPASRKPAGVDVMLGTGQLDKLPGVLDVRVRPSGRTPPAPSGYHDAGTPRPLRRGQLSSYLRISEGCNHRCTFCIIPQLRGNLKSRPPEDIRREAEGLLLRGVRELVVISQDTTDYGRETGIPLTRLLRELLPLPGLRWLRLLYSYPSEVTDELIGMLASEEKLCGYLDMPLQHISDRILKSMSRDWGEAQTRALIRRLKERAPRLALRTTFIVGFPGETEDDFKKMLGLVEEGWFDHMGAFPYSLEGRSPSSRLEGLIPAEVVDERWDRLMAAQDKVIEKKNKARVGQVIEVLAENGPNGEWSARARHQAPEVDGEVLLKSPPRTPGVFQAKITGFKGVDLEAALLEN